MISGTEHLRSQKKKKNKPQVLKSVWLEFSRNKCLLQRVNARAFVPREGNLELGGLDG